MDKSAINKIIIDPSEEYPKMKVEKLEIEVMILKDTITKLIVDIREQMNNAENPFLNFQALQLPSHALAIKEYPIEPEITMSPGMKDNKEEERPDNSDSNVKNNHCGSAIELEAIYRPKPAPALSMRDLEIVREYEEQKKRGSVKYETSMMEPASLTGSCKIDPYTIKQIMDWTRMMVRKNGNERLMALLEMYISIGYITEDTHAIIKHISRLMESESTKQPKQLDIKECVSDLYMLYIILNHGDNSFDSRMNNVLLNPQEQY